MTRKLVKAALSAAACTTLASTSLIVSASPAQAAEYTTTSNCDVPWINCSEGDLWLLYNSKAYAIEDGVYTTSWATFYGNVYNYWGDSQYQGSTLTTYRYVFNNNGKGAGQYVKNNAASVQNCSQVDNYRVYYNSGYGGTSQYIQRTEAWASCNWENLISALKNDNASQHFA